MLLIYNLYNAICIEMRTYKELFFSAHASQFPLAPSLYNVYTINL